MGNLITHFSVAKLESNRLKFKKLNVKKNNLNFITLVRKSGKSSIHFLFQGIHSLDDVKNSNYRHIKTRSCHSSFIFMLQDMRFSLTYNDSNPKPFSIRHGLCEHATLNIAFSVNVSICLHQQKTMPKKSAAEIGCGSFDQPNLQSLNNYIFFFFCFATIIFNILGRVINH